MTPLSWEQIEHLTYEQASHATDDGLIDTETWERYCYEFRNRVYRYSALGKRAAARYAKRHNLPTLTPTGPRNDRPTPDTHYDESPAQARYPTPRRVREILLPMVR